MIKEELSKKSVKLIDDYINGRQQLSSSLYKKLRAELNLCIQELQDLTWNMTCDPSQYDKLKKRLEEYKNFENTMIYVHRFHKELNGDKNRKEFYKVGTDHEEEEPVMKMKLIKVTKKDSKKIDSPDLKALFQDFGKACSKLNNAANPLWTEFVKNKDLKLDGPQQRELLDHVSDYMSELTSVYKYAKGILEDIRKKWKAG